VAWSRLRNIDSPDLRWGINRGIRISQQAGAEARVWRGSSTDEEFFESTFRCAVIGNRSWFSSRVSPRHGRQSDRALLSLTVLALHGYTIWLLSTYDKTRVNRGGQSRFGIENAAISTSNLRRMSSGSIHDENLLWWFLLLLCLFIIEKCISCVQRRWDCL